MADALVAAADAIRGRVRALPRTRWHGSRWKVTECACGEMNCPCIVYQGEYKPFDEAQVPAVEYVADAESPEYAAYIASMHPAVAMAVADLLDVVGEVCSGRAMPDAALEIAAREVAGAYLGSGPEA